MNMVYWGEHSELGGVWRENKQDGNGEHWGGGSHCGLLGLPYCTGHSERSAKRGLAALRTKHAKKDLIKKYLPSILVQFPLSLSLFQEAHGYGHINKVLTIPRSCVV